MLHSGNRYLIVSLIVFLSFCSLSIYGANAEGLKIDDIVDSDDNNSPLINFSDIIKNADGLSDQDRVLLEQVERELALIIKSDGVFKPVSIHSLFFTSWEHALLKDAKSAFKSGMPTAADLLDSQFKEDDLVYDKPEIATIRELALGGLMYVGADKWTLWLNSQRITPESIPEEVMDIKVFGEYIEILWYDKRDDLVYPIRLRPHQRFNLDARMFLPG